MARYKIILAYDGTSFAGVQRQAVVRTVQAEFEQALLKIGWHDASILIAGRTDAGVHAAGQVVSFDLAWQHPLADLLRAINANLPLDMAVQSIHEVDTAFHPRFDAQSRRYQYRIFFQAQRNPLRERFAWRVWQKADLALMQQAAQALPGWHDFGGFGSALTPQGGTVRQVLLANWHDEGDDCVFDIEANAFLYHMVRRIVFVLVRIGQGFVASDVIQQGLSSGQNPVHGLAPASGLTLAEVRY